MMTHGTNELLGLAPERLERRSPPPGAPPLWEGHAGERAAREIERLLSAGL